MEYYLLVGANEEGDVFGPICFPSPDGVVIVLFQDQVNERMTALAHHAYADLPEGYVISSLPIEGSSIEEAARQLKEDYPGLNDAKFLMDSDPLVAQLVASQTAVKWWLERGGR